MINRIINEFEISRYTYLVTPAHSRRGFILPFSCSSANVNLKSYMKRYITWIVSISFIIFASTTIYQSLLIANPPGVTKAQTDVLEISFLWFYIFWSTYGLFFELQCLMKFFKAITKSTGIAPFLLIVVITNFISNFVSNAGNVFVLVVWSMQLAKVDVNISTDVFFYVNNTVSIVSNLMLAISSFFILVMSFKLMKVLKANQGSEQDAFYV